MLRLYAMALGLVLQTSMLSAETKPEDNVLRESFLRQSVLRENVLRANAPTVPFITEVFQTTPGVDFQSEDVKQMQSDDFSNPGFLAVDRGARAYHTAPALAAETGSGARGGKACVDCHESMKGVGARHPKINQRTGELVTLTSQILECRERYQKQPPIGYESPLALALTTYVMSESRGMPFVSPAEDQPHNESGNTDALAQNLVRELDQGRAYYYQRRGQLNLACHHCHEQNAGRMLRGDLISEGVSTGYPIYRLEWQAVGSLHRRFRSCDIGVRAEPAMIGGPVYTQLELYLRKRAGQLTIRSPAVRR